MTTQLTVFLSAAFFVFTRSAGVAYFGSAALGCALSVKALKKLIRQPRPTPGKKTYGMPSTHAAVISFYGAYIYLAATHLPIHRSLPDVPFTRKLPPLLGFGVTGLVTYSRIWCGHHTWPQVIAGCTYGTTLAIIMYRLWIGGLDHYGEILEQWVDARLAYS